MANSKVYDLLDAAAQAVAPQVIGWRQHLHQHPELSNREVNTAKFIADHLASRLHCHTAYDHLAGTLAPATQRSGLA